MTSANYDMKNVEQKPTKAKEDKPSVKKMSIQTMDEVFKGLVSVIDVFEYAKELQIIFKEETKLFGQIKKDLTNMQRTLEKMYKQEDEIKESIERSKTQLLETQEENKNSIIATQTEAARILTKAKAEADEIVKAAVDKENRMKDTLLGLQVSIADAQDKKGRADKDLAASVHALEAAQAKLKDFIGG